MSEIRNEKDYDSFLAVVKKRRTCRDFSPETFPDEYIEKILEPARWALSGANSQPWEFVVVKDSVIRKQLFDAYVNINVDFTFWMEQQRNFELRHPGYQVKDKETPEEALRVKQNAHLWRDAPVVIAVVGDGRKQWGTILGAHTFSLHQSHFTDGLANACQLIHLSAAALGLSSQWVSIHLQDPFKEVLKLPSMLTVHTLIPIGYPASGLKGGYREKLSELIHYDQYDQSRFLSNKQIIERLTDLRKRTSQGYKDMIQEEK
jgi:nitroreductase